MIGLPVYSPRRAVGEKADHWRLAGPAAAD